MTPQDYDFVRKLLKDRSGLVLGPDKQYLVESRLPVEKRLLAPNGFLHAASVVALADTSCGYGCVAALPEGASGFTTIELKSNFLGTAREGAILCRATPVHRGRTTVVCQTTVRSDTGKLVALVTQTQLVIAPGV